MKKLPTLLVASALLSAVAIGQEASDSKQLQIYPKNLARQHVGSNLLKFDSERHVYVPTEAAAAWLDDDITTGWPPAAGKQYYLLALPEPQLLTNFSLSTKSATGSITLYAGDEPAAPGAASWTTVARDVSIETVNQKKLAKPFSRFAKYLLIETNLSDSTPWYSIYAYGEKPSSSYHVVKREQAIDPRSIFGPYVNAQTSFSLSSLYENAKVEPMSDASSAVASQRAIDDNPESGVMLAPGAKGMTVALSDTHLVQRIAILTGGEAKGKLDFYVLDGPTAPAPEKPAATLTFDGTNSRASTDFAPASGSALLVRWTPADGASPVAIQEVNTFDSIALNDYEIALTPEAVAELGNGSDGKTSLDGKTALNGKDLAPIAEGPDPIAEGPFKSPFVPGTLGFPGIVTSRLLPPKTPNLPPSPPVSP